MLDNRIKALDYFLNEMASIPEMKGKKEITISLDGDKGDESGDSDEASPDMPMKSAMSAAADKPEMGDSEDEEYTPEMLAKLFKGMKGSL